MFYYGYTIALNRRQNSLLTTVFLNPEGPPPLLECVPVLQPSFEDYQLDINGMTILKGIVRFNIDKQLHWIYIS